MFQKKLQTLNPDFEIPILKSIRVCGPRAPPGSARGRRRAARRFAPPAGWEQAIQYEFEFDGMLFAPGAIGPSALANGILHASPNKLDGDNKVLIPCLGIAAGQTGACEPTTPPPTAMSEPASGALFLAGLGLLSLYRRRQARN